jgi:hypothetical protein
MTLEKAPDRFRAKATAYQNITKGIATLVTFPTTVDDNANTYNTGTSIFTARVSGLYTFAATVPYAPDTTAIQLGTLTIVHTPLATGIGATVKSVRLSGESGAVIRTAHVRVDSIYLNSGDTIHILATSSSFGDYWDIQGDVTDACWFEGRQIE